MQDPNDTIDLNLLDHQRFNRFELSRKFCITCGLCSSSCPVSGVDGFDPRKIVRMVNLGMESDIVAARWPWICTLCGKCEHVCPMNVTIPDIIKKVRSLRGREEVPGILHKGVTSAINTGNNLGLPKEDYTFIVEDVAEEISQEPGFEGFKVAIDKKGANLLTTIHNKLINTHTEDLKHWWKIFYAAREDWTIPSENWEGTSWGYFTGDDEAVKTMAARIVAHMKRLKIANLLWCE